MMIFGRSMTSGHCSRAVCAVSTSGAIVAVQIWFCWNPTSPAPSLTKKRSMKLYDLSCG